MADKQSKIVGFYEKYEECKALSLEKLANMLKHLWYKKQVETSKKWERTLPFADYFVDRWDKAKVLGFGDGSSVYDNVLILGDVTVGKDTWIGPNTVLDGSGKLTIGNNCSISAGVQIYTHDSIDWALSGGERSIEEEPTRIGNQCYIGPNAIIAKGVTIGDKCIVGANSLVLNDIASGSKAYGTPCKVVDSSR